MNIVVGASGQVGSAVVARLVAAKSPVTAVIRDARKTADWENKGVSVAIADAFDRAALQTAFQSGDAVFLLTPETGKSDDVLGDTQKILDNYRAVIEGSSIKKIVGLSSMGAQYSENAGNLQMSYMLEHAFAGLNVQTIFVRPAYYFSNWLPYLPTVKEQGILPTFYPVDLAIPMSSPLDIAAFVAETMVKDIDGSPIYEVEGPEWYSSQDVADAFGAVLGKTVKAQQIPRDQWHKTMTETMGFTEDAAKNFSEMTELVSAGTAKPEGNGNIPVKTDTTLREYLQSNVKA